MVWNAGKSLNKGKYTIQEVLGEGRFGVTYLARYRQENLVVIKTPREVGFNLQAFKRLQEIFVQEAVKLAKCNHPHIVSIKEQFQEGKLWCIVMEYVRGTTLDKREEKILLEAQALRYIEQIGQALMEVHSHNFLHQDIRPGNIMIRVGKPEAVLIDFGLALDFDDIVTKTRTEELLAGFAPIECYYSRDKRGAYTDIYMLGATLSVLLTGETPVSAIERKIDNKPLIAPKSLNPAISDRTNQAILWAMEFEASKRPQLVQDWLKALGLSPKGVKISNPQPFTINWTTFWAGLAAIATLLGSIAALLTVFKPETPPTSTPNPSVSPSQPASKP